MSDVIEGLRIIEDRTTKKGEPLHRAFEGLPTAGSNALPALVGQKLDGTFSYLAVNDLGQVITETSPDIEARLMLRGKVINSAIGAVSTVVEITLLTNKIYRGIGLAATASRFANFQLIHSDAGVDEVLLDGNTSATQMNFAQEFKSFEFVSGPTGVQKLKLVGVIKEGIASDLAGTIITTEIQDT